MSEDVKAVAQEIFDRTSGQIGTHYASCYKHHLACFAAFVLQAQQVSDSDA